MNKSMILSVGMPRAGSGWYYNLTHDLVVASGGISARTIRAKYPLKALLTEVNCNLGTLSFYRLIPVVLPLIIEPPYVIKLHAERRPLADWMTNRGWIKPTYIYRDPLDALLSAYEYGQRMSAKNLTNAFTPLKTVQDAIHFMESYIPIANGWLKSEKTLSVKYEDLLVNYDREVERLGIHLGIDLGQPACQQVIDQYRPKDQKPEGKGLHFVHGKKGRHRSHLSTEQLEYCDEIFGDFLVEHGY